MNFRSRLASNPEPCRGTICRMRGGRFVSVVSIGMVLLSCDGGEAGARGRNEAVFELGGDTQPLADVLRAAAEARRNDPGALIDVPLMVPAPPRPVRYRTAPLGPGETLSAFCSRELGESARWREVAELNGWSEAELRRLAPGTQVRIPVER